MSGANRDYRPLGRVRAIWIGVVFACTACAPGHVRHLAPPEIELLPRKARVVVELQDGRTVRLLGPRLLDAGLAGIADVYRDRKWLKETRTIPLAEIKLVKIVDKGGLTFAVLPTAVTAIWLIIGALTAPAPPPIQPIESCPFVYSWDGGRFVFEAEPYGGAVCRALQRADWCPLDWLKAANGSCRIRIANELDETQHTDEAALLVVDHAPGLRIAADAGGGLHAFGPGLAPLRAWDEEGRDIRSLVEASDTLFWESEGDNETLGRKADLRHELNFVFPRPAGARQVKLLANAWTSSWGAEVPKRFLAALGRDLPGFFEEVNRFGPAWQRLMAWFLGEELYMLRIQVRTGRGWETRGYIQGGGPFAASDKAYVIDIGDGGGETLELRLCPPVTFWRLNRLAVDYAPDPALAVRELAPRRAVDQDGRDVSPLLAAADGECLVAPRPGCWADVDFEAPPQPPGTARSFILRISGYYDIHVPPAAEPQRQVYERLLGERNFTIRYALEAFSERRRR